MASPDIPQISQGSWQGATGHVQDVLRSRRTQAPAISAQSAVYVCGPKPMVEELKPLLQEMGLDAGRVFQNF
jgi:NAD(P)H-flavin reductase